MAWNPTGEILLEISASGKNVKRISASQFTVDVTASWKTYYDGAETTYGMNASSGGKTVTISNYNANGSSSGSSTFTGTYSISGNGSSTQKITVTFTNFNASWSFSAKKDVTFNVTVPAWTSYTVSYNANGGSGAPSSQTKWKDQTLTLSSTKPTRTGYTFEGWALSKEEADNGTWYYQAGGTCGKNENLTLYAVWEEHKLTVNYYSNYATYAAYKGEESSVSASTNVLVHSQDFYYDNAANTGLADVQNSEYLYLSRIGYTPTGYWGTSTSGGTLIDQKTSYATGQALAQALGKDLSSGNASINIYPQWNINTYTFSYNANALSATGTMNSVVVEWGETFILPNNAFKREGYKFIGWNAHRNADNTWYVTGQGWITENEILDGGYEKKLYTNQEEHVFGNSWVKGDEYTISDYTMYAVWKISGVVYIDNGATLEPYLTYIDNGTDWDLYLAYIDDGVEWNIIS